MGASLCKVNCCKEGLQRALQPIRIDYLSEFYLQPIIIGYLSEFLLLIATFNTSDNPATFWRDTPIADCDSVTSIVECPDLRHAYRSHFILAEAKKGLN